MSKFLIIFDKIKGKISKNPSIHKYKSWDEVPETDLEYWLQKTPAERLAAAKKLNARARKIYKKDSTRFTLFYHSFFSLPLL